MTASPTAADIHAATEPSIPRVRPAGPEEARALAALAARTFPDACPPGMPVEDIRAFIGAHLSEDAFAGYLADQRYLVLVADAPDAAPLGYTLLDTAPEEALPPGVPADGTVAYLSKMYVLEAARGTGAAMALMRATLAAARRRGHRQVWLGVSQVNARARAFYAKAGFAVVGERTFPVGGATGHDHVLLADVADRADLTDPADATDEIDPTGGDTGAS